jgi:hypothetical protein
MTDHSPDDLVRREGVEGCLRRLGLRVQTTTSEIRDAVVAELGEDHAISRFAKDWPTVAEGKATMTIGLRLFHNHQADDGGRAGMLAGLEGALCYLHASLPVSDHSLLLPLSRLLFALRDLERTGRQARCFRATPRGPADSAEIAYLKACALAISDLIVEHKGSSQKEADKEAARKVSPKAKALGVATRIMEKDLKSWRRNTRSRRKQGVAHDRATNSLKPHVAAAHRQIARLASMFGTRELLDLNWLIAALLYHGPRTS